MLCWCWYLFYTGSMQYVMLGWCPLSDWLLLLKKWIKRDHHWQFEDVSSTPAWNIFWTLANIFVYTVSFWLSAQFKQCTMWFILSGWSIHVVGLKAKGSFQIGAAACYSVYGQEGIFRFLQTKFWFWMNIPDLHTGSIKLHLQPLRDCLYLNRTDLAREIDDSLYVYFCNFE